MNFWKALKTHMCTVAKHKQMSMGGVLLVRGVTLDWGQYMTTLQSWTSALTEVLCVQRATEIQLINVNMVKYWFRW